VSLVHRPPHLELLAGIEAVEGGRTFGVEHRDVPLGTVGALRPGDHSARLVRVIGARMGHHGVHQVTTNHQHSSASFPIWPTTRTLPATWSGSSVFQRPARRPPHRPAPHGPGSPPRPTR